jgi:hypothetical protein
LNSVDVFLFFREIEQEPLVGEQPSANAFFALGVPFFCALKIRAKSFEGFSVDFLKLNFFHILKKKKKSHDVFAANRALVQFKWSETGKVNGVTACLKRDVRCAAQTVEANWAVFFGLETREENQEFSVVLNAPGDVDEVWSDLNSIPVLRRRFIF